VAIRIVPPNSWNFVSPSERGASSSARLNGMTILPENPCLFLLEEPPHCYIQTHSHDEPEVMVILEGRMMFNGEWCERGSVIYVPANEDYWHSTAEERCVVALMRPTRKGRTKKTRDMPAFEQAV
jgi:mannose-6-phosphate isomerase-like protein (cupin superfamily)